MKYNIGTESFRTKEDIKERCRDIIAFDVHPRDRSFLFGLIQIHPDFLEKIGAGVDHFFVADAPTNKLWGKSNKCLHIMRTDGSSTDFSFMACITGPTRETQVSGALRRCVDDQIIEFRNKGHKNCAITGAPLNLSDAHVDHYNPDFRNLVKSWYFYEGLGDAHGVELTKGDNSVAKIKDPDLVKSFSEYHREMANLRMTSSKANLSRKRKA